MKNLGIAIFLLWSSLLAAQQKIPKEKWLKLFDQQKYEQVYTDALAMRDEEYGKSATVDFPIPDGPINAVILFSGILREKLFRTDR